MRSFSTFARIMRARDDLFDVDGLGEVVLGARLQALDLRLDGLLAGEEDEVNVTKPLVALDDLAQLEPVHLGHAGLREHEVRRADLDLLERVLSVDRRRHLEAGLLEADLHDAKALRVTIDQEQVLLRHGEDLSRVKPARCFALHRGVSTFPMHDMGADQRKFLRKTLEVRFNALAGTAAAGAQAGQLSFTSADVSAGGVFLKSELLLEQGEALTLEFSLEGRPMRARAKVAWARRFPLAGEAAGMGVEFVEMEERERATLERYLEQ
jgi:uncharacterized protein (TIGR02266 family)